MAQEVKNLPANAGDIRDSSSIPGSGRSPGKGNGNPLQYSFLENPMDRGAWWATVHVVIVRHTQDLRLISITVLGKHLTLVSSFLPKFLPASVSHVACLIPAGGLVPQPTTSVYCRNLPSPFLRSWAGLLLRQVGHETSLLHTNWLNSY